MDRAITLFGGVDILVNNAGILIHAPVLEMREADWDRIFAINVKGMFLFAQAAGRQMVKQGRGRIINMSSCSGKKASRNEAAYCATKAAILGLNRVLALELGPHGIKVNAICPGATDTEMVRSTFLTSPEDRAGVDRQDGPETAGHARGPGPCRGVPGLGAFGAHHRGGAGRLRGRDDEPVGVEAWRRSASARKPSSADLPYEQRLRRIAALGFTRYELWFHDKRFDGARLHDEKKDFERLAELNAKLGLTCTDFISIIRMRA